MDEQEIDRTVSIKTDKIGSAAKVGIMDKIVRVFKSHSDMKAEEYRYWQSRPVHERMDAVAQLTIAAYKMKDPNFNVRRLQRTLVVLQRPQR